MHVLEKPSVTLKTYLALSKFIRRVGSVSEVAEAKTVAFQGEMVFVEPVTCLKPLFDIAVAWRAKRSGANRMGGGLSWMHTVQTSHRIEMTRMARPKSALLEAGSCESDQPDARLKVINNEVAGASSRCLYRFNLAHVTCTRTYSCIIPSPKFIC
jgi:hypothetical protein